MKSVDEMTKQELLQERVQLQKDISKFKNLQLAKKVQLNSAYGALGNQYFRHFDVRMAEGITLSGQLSIRWIERMMNEYLNKLLETEEKTMLLHRIQTRYTSLLTNWWTKCIKRDVKYHLSIRSLPSWTLLLKEIEPYIDRCYQLLAENMNSYAQKMFMKREAIADKGVWTAKKRYILNVYDNEGVRYAEPKLKMMGIETVKSSTPAVCRGALKKAISIIMNEDEKTAQDYINSFREEFRTMPFEDVAFPRSISDLNKYTIKDKNLIIPKGTPIHVRGALVYNHLLKLNKLTKQYELIKDGEKIKFCYLKVPNPARQNIISVLSTLPKKFGIAEYIDYDLQFDKSFLEPLKIILNSVGWSPEKTNTLEDFFG